MKYNNKFQRWIIASLFSLVLAGSSVHSQAQTPDFIIDQFDTNEPGPASTEVGYYGDAGWGGNATSVFSFNTNNALTTVYGATNNPGSGSMEWQIAWASPVNTGDQDVAGRTGFAASANPNSYTNIGFDIMFLPDSATDVTGSTYGTLEPTFYGQSAGWWEYTFASINFPVTNGNGWQHVNIPLDNSGGGAPGMGSDQISGFGFKMQQSKTALIGTTDFLIDNIILSPAVVPPPPPTLSINRVTTPPGLAMVLPGTLAGGNGDGMLLMSEDAAVGEDFSWVGATTNVVTYSMNIASFPDKNHTGAQAALYLIPDGGSGDVAIAGVAATAAEVLLQNNADGSATASFGWKTNSAGATPTIVASITNIGGAVGNWTLSFLNDTNITLSGPGGVSTSFDFSSENIATNFDNPLTVYFGAFNNSGITNAGQIITFSELNIDGAQSSTAAFGGPTGAGPIDDVFTNDGGVINPSYWLVDGASAEAGNQVIVQSSDLYWVGWTLPMTNDLWFSPALGDAAAWADTGLTGGGVNAVYLGTSAEALISTNSGIVPAQGLPPQGYFLTAPADATLP